MMDSSAFSFSSASSSKQLFLHRIQLRKKLAVAKTRGLGIFFVLERGSITDKVRGEGIVHITS